MFQTHQLCIFYILTDEFDWNIYTVWITDEDFLYGRFHNVIKYSNSMTTGQLKAILVHHLPQNMLMEKTRRRITEIREERTSFCIHIAKWFDLESDVKKWITDATNNRISVPKTLSFLKKKMDGCTRYHWLFWDFTVLISMHFQKI